MTKKHEIFTGHEDDVAIAEEELIIYNDDGSIKTQEQVNKELSADFSMYFSNGA